MRLFLIIAIFCAVLPEARADRVLYITEPIEVSQDKATVRLSDAVAQITCESILVTLRGASHKNGVMAIKVAPTAHLLPNDVSGVQFVKIFDDRDTCEARLKALTQATPVHPIKIRVGTNYSFRWPKK